MTVSQIVKFDPFKALSKFSKWQNDLQNHLSFWPTPANVLATSRKCHARHPDEKVSGVLHLSRKQRFRPQNVPDVLRLPHDMDKLKKRAQRAPSTLRERAQSKCTWKSHKGALYAPIYRKNAAPQRAYPDLTPAL